MNFDGEAFESLVWNYATLEGIIKPETWEIITCKSFGGTHIPGDKYMADVFVSNIGFNIKSLRKKFTKGNLQTCDFVQCRCPLNESINIGEGAIKTLVDKREESFKKFNLNKMMDVLILHMREGDTYGVRMFISEQERYEDLNLTWIHNLAYLNSNKQWKLKRMLGNARAFQTCLYVKKVLNVQESIANFKIKCDNAYDISIEEAKERYAKVQEK